MIWQYVLRPLLFIASAVVLAWAAALTWPLGPLSDEQPDDPLIEFVDLFDTEVHRTVTIEIAAPDEQATSGVSDDAESDDPASRTPGVEVTLALAIDSETALARRIQAGALHQDPAYAAALGFGQVYVVADVEDEEITPERVFEWGEEYRGEWQPPVVSARASTTTVTIRGAFPGDVPDLAAVLIALPNACYDPDRGTYQAGCPLEVTLEAPGRQVTAVFPSGALDSLGADRLEATLDGVEDPAQTSVDPIGVLRVDVTVPDAEASALASAVRGWVTVLWRYLWQMLPWIALFVFLLRLRPAVHGSAAADVDMSRGVLARLLWASLVSALLVAAGGVQREVVDTSILAVGPVLLVVWAWHAHRWVWPGASAVRTVVIAVSVVLGGSSVLIVALSTPSLGRLGLGVVVALLGGLGLALALEPSRHGIPAGIAAALVTVLLAVSQDAPAAVDSWLGGVVALFCSMAFLVLLAWVAAIGSGSELMDRARGLWWVRLLTVVVALALLWPDEEPRLASSPFQLQTFVTDFAAASPALIGLALILAAVGLLWAAAAHPLPGPALRVLAILVALALLLRSNVVVGLPWSFLVGSVLVVTVLYVTADQTESRPLWQPDGGQSTARIQEVVAASARAQFHRSLRAAARRRATSGDTSYEEAEAYRRAYEAPTDTLPAPPGETERQEGLGWGAVADPRIRALRSMGVAFVVGIPLSIPYLATAAIQLSGDNLTSVTTWGQIFGAVVFVLRFPLYGLVFGYFYPLIRGATGLGKSMHLLVVLVVSEGITLLIPFDSTSSFLEAFSLRALGLALLCLVLGIGADAWALRQAGSGFADLADLYQVRRATLSISTVLVAALTTAATTLATIGVTSATERLFEKTESPPPAEQVVEGGDSRVENSP